SAAELTDCGDDVAIDVPGHGLSDDWIGAAPTDWAAWHAVMNKVGDALGTTGMIRPALPIGDPDRLFPDLFPDRFGGYLTRAWAIVRARAMFDPWYEPSSTTARDFALSDVNAITLAAAHRALLQARSARQYLIALRSSEGEG
ncbi:MAG: hypothetical protein K2P79_09055, partial [Sphingomonas sp.]|nr:hypothetical protein [Sphingomonas sp.]